MRETKIDVSAEADVAVATTQASHMLRVARICSEDVARITTVVSELARNIVKYAHYGEISLALHQNHQGLQVVVSACDRGPGIADTTAVMQDGFTTGGTLGMGLPGVRRLMDTFALTSQPGKGTCIITSRQLRQQ